MAEVIENKRRKIMDMDTDCSEINEKTITDLNTDCLLHIFKDLDYEDLLNLKKTHEIFSNAIDFTVSKGNYNFFIDFNANYMQKLRTIEEFLEKFGRKIKYLNITVRNMNDDNQEWLTFCVEMFIKNYCANGNIKHYSFFGKLHREFVEKNKTFFDSLETLETNWSASNPADFDLFLNPFLTNKIKKIKINGTYYGRITDIFHKIARLQLESCSLDLETYEAKEDDDSSDNEDNEMEVHRLYQIDEMPINYTLKCLEYNHWGLNTDIVKFFPNLETLETVEVGWYGCPSLELVANLEKLKRFSLKFEVELCDEELDAFFGMLTKLADKNQLESLELGFCWEEVSDEHMAQLTCYLCKMTNLRKLKLSPTNYDFEHFLPQIGQSLQNLQEFVYQLSHQSFTRAFAQGENSAEMLEFLKGAANLTFLEYRGYLADADKFYRDIETIRINQKNKKLLLLKIPTVNKERKFSIDTESGAYVRILKGEKILVE